MMPHHGQREQFEATLPDAGHCNQYGCEYADKMCHVMKQLFAQTCGWARELVLMCMLYVTHNSHTHDCADVLHMRAGSRSARCD